MGPKIAMAGGKPPQKAPAPLVAPKTPPLEGPGGHPAKAKVVAGWRPPLGPKGAAYLVPAHPAPPPPPLAVARNVKARGAAAVCPAGKATSDRSFPPPGFESDDEDDGQARSGRCPTIITGCASCDPSSGSRGSGD